MSALYVTTAAELIDRFVDNSDGERLGAFLTSRCAELRRKAPRLGEIGAWEESLPVLAAELKDAGLGDITMFIEMSMPPWDEQADVVLAGLDAKSEEPTYAIIELKQWTKGEVKPNGKVDVEFSGGGTTSKSHPWRQVDGYGTFLAELYTVLDRDHCKVAVLLHNATDEFMSDLRAALGDEDSNMFGAGERAEFHRFLQGTFAQKRSDRAANWLLRDRLRHPDSLLKRMHAEFDRTAKQRFVLLGKQSEAYDLVSDAIDQELRKGGPSAVIVHGKPGTGKSAVALKLAGESFRLKRGVYYWVWHTAFRNALKKNSNLQTKHAKRLFRSPREHGIRSDDMENSATISICDEAHRLEKRTNNRKFKIFTDQIDDLLWTSNVHVFFIDDDQQMKISEIGTVRTLQKELDKRKIPHKTIELTTQVRSGGVRDYVDWVRLFTGLDPHQAQLWEQREDFKLWIAERPEEVEEILKAQAQDGDKYRITAGICWPPDPDGDYGHVRIDNWIRPWNYKQRNDDGPRAQEWGWKVGGHRQIGCVHTAQGLEWDWAGVIIGKDLVFRDGKVTPDLNENTDLPSYKKNKLKRERAEKLIRNAYYVLMTRGMSGMVVYAQDNLLRTHLRTLVQPLPLPSAAEPEDLWGRARAKLPQKMIDVVEEARDAGFGMPHVGLDYVPGHRSVIAWRDRLTAVLPDDLSSAETTRAEKAYADAGWTAHRQSDWDLDDLQTALRRKR